MMQPEQREAYMRQLLSLIALTLYVATVAVAQTTKVPTLEERKKAVAEQMKIIEGMSGKSVEDQLKIAQEWAKKHRTAQAGGTVDATSQAYAFRMRLYGDSQCQIYAEQADSAFLDSQTSEDERISKLNQIAARAASAGCVATQ